MRNLIGIFFFSLISSLAHAQYGFIRVTVAKPRADHTAPVTLFANGSSVGSQFSHSTTTTGWMALNATHLNPNANETPILARYGFSADACQFDYSIEFSFDGLTVLRSWSGFQAPSSGQVGSIPIGLNCKSMKVCSSDPTLQSKLVENHNRAALENFNRLKREYDRQRKARVDALRSRNSELAQNLKSRPVPSSDKAEKLLKQQIEQWELETQRLKEEAQRFEAAEAAADAKTETAKTPEDVAYQAQKEAIADLRKTAVGDMMMTAVDLDKQLELNIVRQREFNQMLRENRQLTREDVRRLENLEQSTDFLRQEVLRGKTFMHTMKQAAKMGVKLSGSYVSIPITICEIVRGRELCVGREMTTDEVLSSVCRLSLKYSYGWGDIRRLLLDAVTGSPGRLVLRNIESSARGLICTPP